MHVAHKYPEQLVEAEEALLANPVFVAMNSDAC